MKNLTTREVADYLSVTKRTIQRKAIRERWPYDEQKGLGGTKRVYAFATLPDKVKIKVVASIIAGHERSEGYLPDESGVPPILAGRSGYAHLESQDYETVNWLAQYCFARNMDESALTKDFVKLGILSLARLYVAQSGYGKIKGFDRFCQIYNTQKLDIDKAIFSVVKRVSRITLLRWEKQDLPLGPEFEQLNEVARRDDKAFDYTLKAMAEEVLMVAPGITAKRLRAHFLTFFNDRNVPSQVRIACWLNELKTGVRREAE